MDKLIKQLSIQSRCYLIYESLIALLAFICIICGICGMIVFIGNNINNGLDLITREGIKEYLSFAGIELSLFFFLYNGVAIV